MTSRPQLRNLLVVVASGALLAGLGVVPAGGVGAQDPGASQPPLPTGCAAPYPARFAAVTYPVAEPVVPPWSGGTVLAYEPGPLDTDGDGITDVVTDLPGNAFRIDRTGGSLTLPAKTFFANRDDAVDLDGDGRSDLIVVADSSGPTPGTYLVPGATPDGAVDLATEATRLPDHLGNARGIGHQDGDASDDIAANAALGGQGETRVYSGADLSAPGPGGTADPDPIAGTPARSSGWQRSTPTGRRSSPVAPVTGGRSS